MARAAKKQSGSALIVAVVLTSLMMLLVTTLVTLVKLNGARAVHHVDEIRANLLAQSYADYAIACIRQDTFGSDSTPYNNDDGDEAYDSLDDRIGPYSLREWRDGKVLNNKLVAPGVHARVTVHIDDHESKINLNVHGNIWRPESMGDDSKLQEGRTAVSQGVSPAEIAPEDALVEYAVWAIPCSFGTESTVRETMRRVVRQIIASSRFFALPEYFRGGRDDRLDNHARFNWWWQGCRGAAQLFPDRNRNGYIDPSEILLERNRWIDMAQAEAGFPSFFAVSPYSSRFGFETELALAFARYYPVDPSLSGQGRERARIEGFAKDPQAGKLVEKTRLFMTCFRAVFNPNASNREEETERAIERARYLFAALAARVTTLSADPNIAFDRTHRVNVNDPDQLGEVRNILMERLNIGPAEADQICANIKTYRLPTRNPSPWTWKEEECKYNGRSGLPRFVVFNEILLKGGRERPKLSIEIVNPFPTKPLVCKGAAWSFADMQIVAVTETTDADGETEAPQTHEADLGGETIRRGDQTRSFCTFADLQFDPQLRLNYTKEEDLLEDEKRIVLTDLVLQFNADGEPPHPFGSDKIDHVPRAVLEPLDELVDDGASLERVNPIGASGSTQNWVPCPSSGKETMGSPNDGGIFPDAIATVPYLWLGGDNGQFATIADFCKLLRVGADGQAVCDFLNETNGDWDPLKICALPFPSRKDLYNYLTTKWPMPTGDTSALKACVNEEDRTVREGLINVNTAPVDVLFALPFMGEAEGNDSGSCPPARLPATESALNAHRLQSLFQGGSPMRKISDLARWNKLQPDSGSAFVPSDRFPGNYSAGGNEFQPMPEGRIDHPEDREFVLGVLANCITYRSSVFTIFVRVELLDQYGRPLLEKRLVALVDRSRPEDPPPAPFVPKLRVLMRHFVDAAD